MARAFNFRNQFNKLRNFYQLPEDEVIQHLLKEAGVFKENFSVVKARADAWVETIRQRAAKAPFVEAFMQHYSLASKEGLLLMSLAEALLRIPDKETADLLIQDKLTQGDFAAYLKGSSSTLVNMSTFALKVLTSTFSSQTDGTFKAKFKQALSTTRDPVLRRGALWAMKLLSNKFVMGGTIEEALARSKNDLARGYTHSYDMLGEAALTEEDAHRYFEAYIKAIQALAAFKGPKGLEGPSISIKLSALHPRYEVAHLLDVKNRLGHRLKLLAYEAAKADIALTIDAEEADRLELSLELLADLCEDSHLKGWEGLGLAVQAYQKRATAVIDWVGELAQRHGRRLGVRLVKGAYWDAEIKLAQERGLKHYPVFTRKRSTDLSFLVCAAKLLKSPELFYPAFATHNALTVSALLELVGTRQDFEFQRLHGMGEDLYEQIVPTNTLGLRCRIYSPVGHHQDLLPYLVRRLLENGSNGSFVNQLVNSSIPLEELNANPVEKVEAMTSYRHRGVPLPRDLYKNDEQRDNAGGIDFSDAEQALPLLEQVNQKLSIQAKPLLGTIHGEKGEGEPAVYKAPFNSQLTVGTCGYTSSSQIADVLGQATDFYNSWHLTPVAVRTQKLRQAADLLEKRLGVFVQLLVMEAGKTGRDAVAEVREGIDFCRYYANQADKMMMHPVKLPGPTGEENYLYLRGRGLFACISPWNFPLAIFLGQIAAALVTGNVVIAKPASQTPLVAYEVVKLLYEAGIPPEALYFTPMKGEDFSATVLQSPLLGGVVFTGSTNTAWAIQKTLALKQSAIVPFIAETGGQNAMIVDSSALTEQVVKDVITSSFQSAGQRCSALRLLFIQEDIAPRFKEILKGAMKELKVGDPRQLATDVGPVIDQASQEDLLGYIADLTEKGYLVYQTPFPLETKGLGFFVPPTVFELPDLSFLTHERFGPILHMVTYKAKEFEEVCQRINDLGYGLTFGLHSRLDHRIQGIASRIRAGNIYVNRNMIGAVVGVQPFGGQGLSGTGPKAGGPYYLHRFVTEQTLCINTTASGGDAALMEVPEE